MSIAPEHVKRVIKAYEKARKWSIENPEEAAAILAREARIQEDVAFIQMERNDFSQAVPGRVQHDALLEAGRILQAAGVIRSYCQIWCMALKRRSCLIDR